MIDNDIKCEKREGNEYPPLPKDVYQVELLDITSEEKPTYDTRNKEDNEKEYETVFSFQFTLLEGTDNSQEKDELRNLRVRNVWANFVPSYLYEGKKGKNKLYKIVEALQGEELSREQEAYGVDGLLLNSFIGTQCRISVEPKQSGDKSFDNITDYLKANTQLTALTAEEREKARVKKDDEKKEEVSVEEKTEIAVDNLPLD